MKITFEVGDMVRLRSGGPPMTIEKMGERHVNLIHFTGPNQNSPVEATCGPIRTEGVPLSCLVPVNDFITHR